jgi:hypothetical protein
MRLECNHQFCRDCLKTLFLHQSSSLCPLCRAPMQSPDLPIPFTAEIFRLSHKIDCLLDYHTSLSISSTLPWRLCIVLRENQEDLEKDIQKHIDVQIYGREGTPSGSVILCRDSDCTATLLSTCTHVLILSFDVDSIDHILQQTSDKHEITVFLSTYDITRYNTWKNK